MKNKKRLFLIIVIISFSLTNCKKGEDDPFLSLRSRKNRICGEWTLKSGNQTQKNSNSEIVQTWDGNYRYISSDTIPYQEKWTINKNGTIEISTTTTSTNTIEGTWSFGNKDKGRDIKNKETWLVRITKIHTYQWPGLLEISYSGTLGQVYSYTLKELSNKTLTIITDGTSTQDGITTTHSGSMTYEKQK